MAFGLSKKRTDIEEEAELRRKIAELEAKRLPPIPPLDVPVIDAKVDNKVKEEPKENNEQVTVEQLIIARAQVDIELSALIVDTHRMVKEMYEKR